MKKAINNHEDQFDVFDTLEVHMTRHAQRGFLLFKEYSSNNIVRVVVGFDNLKHHSFIGDKNDVFVSICRMVLFEKIDTERHYTSEKMFEMNDFFRSI